MPSTNLNGASSPSRNSYTDGYAKCGASVPTGRVTSGGKKPCYLLNVGLWLAGYGAARTVSEDFTTGYGTGSTSSHSIASDSSPNYVTHSIAAGSGWSNGGSTTFKITMSGTTYYGATDISGSASVTNPYDTFANRTITAKVSWAQAPVAPVMVSLTPGAGGQVTSVFSWTGDNGGTAVTGYFLQIARDAAFTDLVFSDVVASGTNIHYLDPNQEYYYRAAADNAATTMAGEHSAWSNVMSVVTESTGVVWDGTAWVPVDTAEAFDGGEWVAVEVDVFTGTAWVEGQ